LEIDGTALTIDVPLDAFVAAIARHIVTLKPEIVLTHGSNGEYGHPQHVYTYQAVRQAVANSPQPITLLTWGAWYDDAERPIMLNQDDPADIVRDITPWLDQKIAAAMCHRTQHAMFLRNSGAPGIPAMVPRIESFHQWK